MEKRELVKLVEKVYELAHRETGKAERGEVGDLDNLLDVEMYLMRLLDGIEGNDYD